eukprot:447186_1
MVVVSVIIACVVIYAVYFILNSSKRKQVNISKRKANLQSKQNSNSQSIAFIRHGEAIHNVNWRALDERDAHLTDNGIEQIEKLRTMVLNEFPKYFDEVELIVTSPLIRTLHWKLVFDKLPRIFVMNYRSKCIIVIRTFSSIIIPFLASMFLLSDCMNYWTKAWKICLDEPGIFSVRMQSVAQAVNTTQLLSPQEICDPVNNFHAINWQKCLRQFYGKWSIIMIEKLIIMCVMPIFVIIFKSSRSWFLGTICKWKKFQNKVITIDMEMAMILTKIEIMISYCLISPLIVPIGLISLRSNLYFYNLMVQNN